MLQDEKKETNNTGKHMAEVHMNRFTEIKALATGKSYIQF